MSANCGFATQDRTGCFVRGGEIIQCHAHAAAPELLAACKAMMRAADELLTEFISKKRAANWQVINEAMVEAGRAIQAAEKEG